MAGINSIKQTDYAALPMLINRAIEITNELSVESSRDYCLASMITLHSEEDSLARGVSEVLEERLSGNSLMSRLIECLTEIQKEVCHG